MKMHYWLVPLLLAVPLTVHAQAARLKLPDFSGLSGKATESVDISLDGDMLRSAGQFMGGSNAQASGAVSEALKGIQGIYIRVFEFEQPNVYSTADLAGVRKQLEAPGWKRLMSVHSKDGHVDLFLRDAGKDPNDGGMAMVISEPKEFVIINIVGNVDPEKLRQLQGKFGVPSIPGLGTPASSADKESTKDATL